MTLIRQSKTEASVTLPVNANFRHLVGDIVWFGVAMAATSRFLSVFAIRVGASPVELGLIASLPSLIVVLSASFGSWWARRYNNPVRSLFLPGLFMRSLFLLPAFAPLLPLRWQPFWLILSISLPALTQGPASVSFFVIMRGAVKPEQMTRLLSYRQLAVNLTVAAGALVFGVWLEQAPFPLNYQIMFMVAFAFSLISLYHCVSIRVPDVVREPKSAAPAQALVMRAPSPWRTPNFQKVAFIAATIHIAYVLITPVLPLYLVKQMGADEGYMALYGMIELAAGAVAAIIAPRVASRLGNRPLIALGIAGTSLGAVIIALAPNLYVALVAAVFSGCWTAAAGVSLMALFVENAPEGDMTPYSTAYNQVIGLAMFTGPMIGSLLASSGISLIAIILLGAALRLCAAPLVDFSLFSRWLPRRHAPKAQPESVPQAQAL
jgi:MFS family permease